MTNRNAYINANDSEFVNAYRVGLWPGCGYCLDTFDVRANHEEQALEIVLAYCQQHNYISDFVEVEDECLDELTEDELEEMYYYIDPTMEEPSARPAYIRLENLFVEKIGA